MDGLTLFNNSDSLLEKDKSDDRLDTIYSGKSNLYITKNTAFGSDTSENSTSSLSQAHAYTSRFLFYFIIAFCLISLTLALAFLVNSTLSKIKCYVFNKMNLITILNLSR